MIKNLKPLIKNLSLLIYFSIIISPSLIFYFYHSKITFFVPFVILFQLSILLLLAGIIRHRIFIFLSFFPFYITAIINWGHYFIFKDEISRGAFAAILATNFSEAFEYVQSLPWAENNYILILILIPPILYFLMGRKFNLNRSGFRVCLGIILVSTVLKGIQSKNFENVMSDLYLKSQPLRTIIYFTEAYQLKHELEEKLSSHKNLKLPVERSEDEGPETHVIVIGETARRQNWEIYGYKRPTNKFTKTLKHQPYVFKNVASSANTTILSLINSLTYSNSDGMTTILDIAKEGGFKTFWLSNQDKYGVFDNPVSLIASRADEQVFVTSKVIGKRYDDNLLRYLDKTISDNSNRKLIFVHLMGSHLDYGMRYPETFRVFKEADDSDNKLINDYDNSILFTDYVLSEIVNRVIQNTGVASVLYFSDHGESLNEDGYIGHGSVKVYKSEVDVPMVLWVSEDFKSKKPKLNKNILSSLDKEISLFDLFPSFVYFIGLKVNLENTNNFFHPDFKPNERYVLNPNNMKLKYRELK